MKTRLIVVLTFATASLILIGAAVATAPKGVVGTPLARGGADELRIRDNDQGFRLRAKHPTDIALVKATIDPGGYTGWHGHAGPSFVIVKTGTLAMYLPNRRGNGCTVETFGPGSAFDHPSGPHNFVNAGTETLEFYIAYFLPKGASPAPIDAPLPAGCPI
jgi:quercetin dioxygenase-like cupin family protein